MSDLLKETPDLVSQFKASYGRGIMNHNEGKLEMNRATSNDTIVQNRPDQHEDCLNLSEVQPLLEQDPESGTCAPSTHSFYKKLFVSFLVLSLVLAFISASAIYFDWISLLK